VDVIELAIEHVFGLHKVASSWCPLPYISTSSSFIHGINHTNFYIELAIGNYTQYKTFYLKLRQLAIGLANEIFQHRVSVRGYG